MIEKLIKCIHQDGNILVCSVSLGSLHARPGNKPLVMPKMLHAFWAFVFQPSLPLSVSLALSFSMESIAFEHSLLVALDVHQLSKSLIEFVTPSHRAPKRVPITGESAQLKIKDPTQDARRYTKTEGAPTEGKASLKAAINKSFGAVMDANQTQG